MITYSKFKEIFEKLDSSRNPEIEIFFNNKQSSYMLTKYNDFITFQR